MQAGELARLKAKLQEAAGGGGAPADRGHETLVEEDRESSSQAGEKGGPSTDRATRPTLKEDAYNDWPGQAGAKAWLNEKYGGASADHLEAKFTEYQGCDVYRKDQTVYIKRNQNLDALNAGYSAGASPAKGTKPSQVLNPRLSYVRVASESAVVRKARLFRNQLARARAEWKSPYIHDAVVVQEGGQVLDEYQLEQLRREQAKEERKRKGRTGAVKRHPGIDVLIDEEEWLPDYENLRASLRHRQATKRERKLRRAITRSLERCADRDRFQLPDEYESEVTSRTGSFHSGDVFTDDEHAVPHEKKADVGLRRKLTKDLSRRAEGRGSQGRERAKRSKNVLQRKPGTIPAEAGTAGVGDAELAYQVLGLRAERATDAAVTAPLVGQPAGRAKPRDPRRRRLGSLGRRPGGAGAESASGLASMLDEDGEGTPFTPGLATLEDLSPFLKRFDVSELFAGQYSGAILERMEASNKEGADPLQGLAGRRPTLTHHDAGGPAGEEAVDRRAEPRRLAPQVAGDA